MRLIDNLRQIPWKKGDLCVVRGVAMHNEDYILTRLDNGEECPGAVWSVHFEVDKFMTAAIKAKNRAVAQDDAKSWR